MKSDIAKQKPVRIVSAILSDGTLVEAVKEVGASTRFALSKDGVITSVLSIANDGVTYAPVLATHNLIKHQAIHLPGLPKEYGDTAQLLADIESYARRYLALSEPFLKIAASYVLLTWVYDAFNEVPYLRFRGDYGSGKTRALLIFGSIAYKGFFASGASTVSPIFHTLDAFKATLIFDEADFRFTDEKAELVKILNNGNVRGFSVLRTQVNAAKEFEPRAFSVYGPKIVAMRGMYEDRALESRFLTEEMSGRRLPSDIPISLPGSQEAEAAELRCKLLMFRFRERATVAIDPSLADPFLEPRMNQILLPLLSIAPTRDAREAIRKYADATQEAVVADRAETMEGRLLAIVAAALSRDDGLVVLPLQIIAKVFVDQFGADYERPITNRLLANVLRNRLGLQLYKTNGAMALSLKDRARIEALFVRHGIGENEWKNAA